MKELEAQEQDIESQDAGRTVFWLVRSISRILAVKLLLSLYLRGHSPQHSYSMNQRKTA